MIRAVCAWRSFPGLLAAVVASLLLSACGSLSYYTQAVHGQGELLVHRRSIGKLLHDSHTDPKLAARLRLALQAREFASRRRAAWRTAAGSARRRRKPMRRD